MTVPGNNVMTLGKSLQLQHSATEIWPLGASAIFLSVVLSPAEFQKCLSDSCAFVGQISFSMYLLHMSVFWAIGFPLYVWLEGTFSQHHDAVIAVIAVVCFSSLLICSHVFSQAIEESLGVRLPQQAFVFLKECLKTKESSNAAMSMNDALDRVALALESVQK